MPSQKPIRLEFEEGIDRKLLKTLRERFLTLNAARLARTREGLAQRHQPILDILPLLFHLNHPSLPGFVSSVTPCGVDHYHVDRETLRSAHKFFRTLAVKEVRGRKGDIEALFMMGSTGTLAHSEKSDIDLWLCHRAGLEAGALAELQRKAVAIGQWAGQQGLELHIFLMQAQAFRHGRSQNAIDQESSGSAQHYLLLDEFYRTSIWLGGRTPVWWLVPAQREHDYGRIVKLLLERRFINPAEVIDFGHVADIPKEEFVGAGMWQLYKGIDAPYKSLLKLMLAEVYAHELPKAYCLSLTFKAQVFAGDATIDVLDPYVMLYRRLEHYLQGREEFDRLELVRRAFYLKVGKRLSVRPAGRAPSWQQQVLQDLVGQWQWQPRQLQLLDGRSAWKAAVVYRERKTIVNALTHSYRFLSQYARVHQLKASISAGEMNLLGRKLYAAFQRKAGKVEMINPGIAPSLYEESLSLHHQSSFPGAGDIATGWLLFADLATPADALASTPLKRSLSLIELVAWAWFNGLVSRATRFSLVAGDCPLTMQQFRQVLHTFESFLPMPLPPLSHAAFEHKQSLRKLLLLINVGVDPLQRYSARGIHKLSDRTDSLGFSAERDNLVVTIDKVELNSWNEVHVQRFETGDTLIQCLKSLLLSLGENLQAPLPQWQVKCFCLHRAAAIARRVEDLLQSVIDLYCCSDANRHARYVIEIEFRYFVLQFVDIPRFFSFDRWEALAAHLAQPQAQYSPIVLDSYALQNQPRIRALLQYDRPGVIQVFFYAQDKQAEICVLDERGSLFCWQSVFFNTAALLQPLQRFLTAVAERRQMSLSIDEPVMESEIEFAELVAGRDPGVFEVRKRGITPDAAAFYIDIQAIGHRDLEGRLQFDIYCDQQEFTSLEYGDQLINAVAHYIKTMRHAAQAYPCYITDLGLPGDMDLGTELLQMQTMHYLQYKQEIERLLNQALASLYAGSP